MVRLGRKRSDELFAKFTSFPQGNDVNGTYANDTVGSLTLHGAPVAPPPRPGLLLSSCLLMTWLTTSGWLA